MKNFLILILMASFYSLSAQGLLLGEGQVKHDKDMRPSVEVSLEPSADQVKGAWEDFIKKNYKVKLKGYSFMKNKDVLSAEEVKFKAISDKKMDFYTRIVEEGGTTKMYVYGAFGYDMFINSKGFPLEYQRMEAITKKFLNSYLPGYYTQQIKESQGMLDKVIKEKSDMEKEIEDNKKQMERLRDRNDQLTKELPGKLTSIDEITKSLKVRESNWSEVKGKLGSFNLPKN